MDAFQKVSRKRTDCRRAADLRRKFTKVNPDLDHKLEFVVTLTTLGGTLNSLHRTTDAEPILKETLAEWFRAHSADVQSMGKEAGRTLVQTLIGMVLGAMVALHEALPIETNRPLARELVERAARLGDAFRRVVFAQVQISLINTVLTGIYLALVLPSFGVNLPFKKTLIVVTFITGLLPVVGNLISNVVIVVVSLSYSLNVAIGSLLFLIVIHKLEYFLNARIVGRRVEAHAWELLLAMLAMEAAFGISGVIAAPIYYAYLTWKTSSDNALKRDMVGRGYTADEIIAVIAAEHGTISHRPLPSVPPAKPIKQPGY